MDPLYANLDKRNNSADQPQTPPAPQPTAYSMPNFGQPGISTTPTTPIVSNPDMPTPNATAPTTPIMSTPTRPTASGSGDIILNIDQPKKKSKGITIAIIVAIICIIGGIATWAFLQFGKGTKEEISLDEARNRVVNLTSDYMELISAHSRVSSAFLEERIKSDKLIFPTPIGSLETIKDASARVTDDLSQLNVAINGISQSQLQSLDMVEEKANKVLAIVSQNNNLLTSYYNAFIMPIQDVVAENGEISSCNKTTEQKELLSSDTKDAAEAYFTLYCSAIDMANLDSLDEEDFIEQANEAAKLLSAYLLEIEDQTQVINALQNLKKEMAPNENKE